MNTHDHEASLSESSSPAEKPLSPWGGADIVSIKCDDCEYCQGKGGREDEESQDQWHWCEYCDAYEKYAERNHIKLDTPSNL